LRFADNGIPQSIWEIRMGKMKKLVACGLGAAAIGMTGPALAADTPVGLELLLLMDVSGSIDSTDFDIQKTGYKNAFLDAAVQGYIAATPGGVWVSLVQWSTGQSTTIGGQLLQTAADATAFANLIGAMGRSSSGSTGTTAALNYGANLLANNGYQGAKVVIDLSSDGMDNTASGCGDFVPTCVPLQNARNAFLADPIHAINALWIADPGQYTSATLATYGATNVYGGPNAFQVQAATYADFDSAIKTKLQIEIGQLPEPASLALFGLGLAALGFARRKQQ